VIANEMAAATYGLSIVKRDIQDCQDNHTRFVILDSTLCSAPDWSSWGSVTIIVVFGREDSFAFTSNVESRPTKTGLGNYFFIIDIEQAMDQVLIPGAVQAPGMRT
jgi:prephenate dehydratase